MTTKTKDNKVSEEFKAKIENIFMEKFSIGICYEDLIIKDNTPDSEFNINSWVKAYHDYGVSVLNRSWYDERNKTAYDLEDFNCFGVSGTCFELSKAHYRSKRIKNNKIKRLLSVCSQKTKQNADVYIIEIDSKIYIHIDKD
jgi:hypothetical protein